MADVKRYEDYGIPLLRQGGWERTGEGNDYIKYTDPENPNKQLRICTLDYIPNLHPNTITITGKANKEIEVSLLALRNDNYIIAALGWHENGYVFDIGNDYDKLAVMFRYADNSNITPNDVTLDGVWAWVHSLRKLTTATEAVENPLYSDGTAITAYTLKGNTVQNGTPTPDNPVDVNGVGEIDNIFEGNIEQGGYSSGNPYTAQNRVRSDTMILTQPNVRYYMNFTGLADQFTIIQYTTNGTYSKDIGSYLNAGDSFVFSSAWKLKFVFRNSGNTNISPSDVSNISLSHGYKIPISSGGVTTNIYLGSTQTTRQIKKLVLDGTENWSEGACAIGYRFSIPITSAMQSDKTIAVRSLCTHQELTSTGNTYNALGAYTITGSSELIMTLDGNTRLASWKSWLAAQYANGTPVTIWYVLVTSQTATVNEPLMKIGEYADTVSNAASIPTTGGANSITVDTTVQPSEFTATWTGWHDASVKEWNDSQWN